ncbi:IS3 family transposase [Trueperella sp.]|uniref:IS3 family transposase n=1 Tax=Trueperella sp. TaxID=2699835 RepID=UPI0039C891F6
MIAFIDEYRKRFLVEFICRVLGEHMIGGFITSGGYRLTKSRPASARSIPDRMLIDELRKIHARNYGVYGVGGMWHAARRAGWNIARDQVARLMTGRVGLSGVAGRTALTTVMISARGDANFVTNDLVNETMLISNSSRPIAS